MSEQTDREAILREIAKKRVRYELPGMAALPVRRDIRYLATSGHALPMDIYYPRNLDRRPPVVVVAFGYPDPDGGIRQFGPYTSWAQLVAASGMAMILYGSEAPAEDIYEVLRHVRGDAEALGVDAARIGLFSASGNVPVALSTLIGDPDLRCAALLCGYTMDADDATAVADASREYGFVDACAGKSVDDLPTDAPMLFVRAGRDQVPGLNDALDKVVARSIARNLPLTLVNHAEGAHGFDCDEHSPIAREVVRQVLAFLAFHLNA
jgi:acetyl esterase/lipase